MEINCLHKGSDFDDDNLLFDDENTNTKKCSSCNKAMYDNDVLLLDESNWMENDYFMNNRANSNNDRMDSPEDSPLLINVRIF